MITLDKAIDIARESNPTINYCEEETWLWVFHDKYEDESPDNQPVVVLKRDGTNLYLDKFLHDYIYTRKIIKKFYLEDTFI